MEKRLPAGGLNLPLGKPELLSMLVHCLPGSVVRGKLALSGRGEQKIGGVKTGMGKTVSLNSCKARNR